MRHTTWIAVATLAVVASHVSAAEPDVAPAASGNAPTIVSQAGTPASQTASMTAGVAPVGKTRAEVMQELIQAEKDGSLARLNALLYSH
jgi:hypothetical protein